MRRAHARPPDFQSGTFARARPGERRIAGAAGVSRLARLRRWPQSIRYSSLDEITRENAQKLEVAWSYDTGEPGGLRTNPIVAGGVLFTTTPKNRVIALDAATGALVWRFDPGIESSGPNRGVTHWASGGDRRIFTTQGRYVYALDAATGKPIASFASEGRIDLHQDLGRPPELQSATYEAGGRPFVVVPAGSGKDKSPSGGVYVAFALPRKMP